MFQEYDNFGENDNTFLASFVESQAVKLGTPLSVILAELQKLAFQDGGEPELSESELSKTVPPLASIRPSNHIVSFRRSLGLEQKRGENYDFQQVVLLPTESTIPEITQNTALNSILELIQRTASEMSLEVGGETGNSSQKGLITIVEVARKRQYTR